jgi:tryptophan halogenase
MNIVIVGGGTAGWIASYFILNAQPNKHNVTVIESSKIGIIGAGEGSTGSMLDLLSGTYFNSRIDIYDFLSQTDGTPKMGIYHENWKGDGEGYFAPLDGSESWAEWDDYLFKYAYAAVGKDQMHVSSPLGYDYESKNYHPAAFHFDGHKVGEFFKKKCLSKGATIIDAVVEKIEKDESNNIISLELDNQQTIKGDMFIDCTGFARLLMKELGVGWKSYKDYLPVNRAMPFLVNYEEGETPPPFTRSTAMSSGWMWTIPLQSRKGCGYVYDSNYITDEEAQAEIENYLGKKIKPIKFIKFESGSSEVFWKNNVLALGLASAFVEPLEATSIHSTIMQLLFFVNEYLVEDKENTITDYNIETYNKKIGKLYDINMDFISFHYQGQRNDSPFWNSIQENKKISPYADIYLKRSKNKIPSILETDGLFGTPTAALWNWIGAGLGIITRDQAEKELRESGLLEKAKLYFKTRQENEKNTPSY